MLLDSAQHEELQLLKRAAAHVVLLDGLADLVAEPILRLPDVILLHHRLVVRSDLLYVEQPGLEVEQRLTRRLNRLQALPPLADWLQGKITHPLSASVKVLRPRAEV